MAIRWIGNVARSIKLREVQISFSGERDIRLEVAKSANVVEAAFERSLPPMITRGTAKVAITLCREIVEGEPPVCPIAPDGRDGDDVDIVKVVFDPDPFLAADHDRRRRLLTDIITSKLLELALVRGWDSGPIRIAQEQLAQKVAYDWAGPTATSPNRHLIAKCLGWIVEDGAFVEVEITEVSTGKIVARSARDKLQIAHPVEIKMRANRLRWDGNNFVQLFARPIKGFEEPSYPPLAVEVKSENYRG